VPIRACAPGRLGTGRGTKRFRPARPTLLCFPAVSLPPPSSRPRTAFLPAAGLGSRLGPLTAETPKALLPVGGETLLTRAMTHAAEAGIRRFLVTTHLHPEAFTAHFPDGTWRGLPVELVHEPYRLETGGGLRNLEGRLGPEPLLLLNPDTVTDAPLEKLFAAHAAAGGERLVTLGTLPGGPEPHVLADSVGRVRALGPATGAPPAFRGSQRHTYLGLSVVEPAFLAYLRPGVRESVVAGWRRALTDRPDAVALCPLTPCRWEDAGTLDAYERLRPAGLAAARAWPGEPA